MTFAPANSLRPFLQSTIYFPKDPGEFQVKMSEVYKDISFNVNAREVGYFTLQEQLTGQQYSDPADAQTLRQAFRKTFFLPAPLGATASVLHGFTDAELAQITWVHIYGAYTDKTGSPRGASIASEIDVNPTAGSNITFSVPVAFQVTYSSVVILEYLKT